MINAVALPRDQASERSLVACAMLDPRLIDEILTVVRVDMIFETTTREVFSSIIEMHNRNIAIDEVTLQRELKKQKKLDTVGGTSFLVELMAAVPHTGHWKFYAEAVRNDWMRREALLAGEEIIRKVTDQSFDAEEAIAAADRTMIELIESIDTGSKSATDIGPLLLDLEEVWSQGEEVSKGIPAHAGCLTEIVGGFAPGNLVIVAARPSVGKTAFALNLIVKWAKLKLSGLMISAEQSKLEIAERLLAIQTGHSIHDMINGKVDSTQFEAARSEMLDWMLTIDDRGGPSIMQVESTARMFKRKKDIQYLIVDYLQLINPADRKVVREQQVAENSSRLKALAKSLEIPVIVLAQLNRQSEARETKRPKLSDLRESGSIEQDADKVILLWRQHMDNPDATEEQKNEAVAIVAKNRQGPIGDAKMVYRAHCFHFAERVNEYRWE